jgi:hypothetical protein
MLLGLKLNSELSLMLGRLGLLMNLLLRLDPYLKWLSLLILRLKSGLGLLGLLGLDLGLELSLLLEMSLLLNTLLMSVLLCLLVLQSSSLLDLERLWLSSNLLGLLLMLGLVLRPRKRGCVNVLTNVLTLGLLLDLGLSLVLGLSGGEGGGGSELGCRGGVLALKLFCSPSLCLCCLSSLGLLELGLGSGSCPACRCPALCLCCLSSLGFGSLEFLVSLGLLELGLGSLASLGLLELRLGSLGSLDSLGSLSSLLLVLVLLPLLGFQSVQEHRDDSHDNRNTEEQDV